MLRGLFEGLPTAKIWVRTRAMMIAFITEHKVIRKILDHLDKRNGDSRAPPNH